MNIISKILIGCASLASLTFTLSSCKKEFSNDDPRDKVQQKAVYSVNASGVVYAINPEDGSKIWERKLPNTAWATPVVFSNYLYVFETNGNLDKIDPKTGEILNTIVLPGTVTGTPLVAQGRIFVPVGTKVMSIDPNNMDPRNVWIYDAGEEVKTSPVMEQMTIYNKIANVVFVAGKEHIHAIKADSMLVVYKKRVGTGDFESSISAPNKNFLYVGNNDKNLYALNLIDGTVFWSYPTASEIKSSPISIGGNIIVGGGDNKLYSVDSATGMTRWIIATNDRILSSPVYYNQTVYFGCNDFNLYAVDVIDGVVKWKGFTDGVITTSPVIYNNQVFFTSADQNLYALNATTGMQKWVHNINGITYSSPIVDTIGGAVYPSISGNYPY